MSIEDILIKSKVFSLPGKKALLKSDTEFEVILIDATESPIERPKKKNAVALYIMLQCIAMKCYIMILFVI